MNTRKMVISAITACGLAMSAYGAESAEKQRRVAAGSEAPSGPPAAATTQPAPKIVRTETMAYDNWTVSCVYTDQGGAKSDCSAVLRIAEKINDAPRVIFTWIIANQNAKPVSVLSVPTGVVIGPGVEVKIGAGPVTKYGYSLCAPDHCEAVIPMDSSVLTAMKRAPETEATIVGLRGQSVKFTVNMKGFDQALAAVMK